MAKVLFGSWQLGLFVAGVSCGSFLVVGALMSDTIRFAAFDIAAVVLGTLGAISMVTTAVSWFRARSSLREREHFAILIVVAIYAAALFGTFNFLLSRIDPGAFVIDSAISKALSGRAIAAKERSDAIIEECDELAAKLDHMPEATFERPTWRRFTPFAADGELDVGDARLYVTIKRDENTSLDLYVVEIDSEKASFSVAPIHMTMITDTSHGPEIAKGLRVREQWERDHEHPYLVAEAERAAKDRPSVSAWMFLYQAVMDVLGANPNYLKPLGVLPQLAAFFYTLLKYSFFSIFLTLVARHFTSKPAT